MRCQPTGFKSGRCPRAVILRWLQRGEHSCPGLLPAIAANQFISVVVLADNVRRFCRVISRTPRKARFADMA